MSDKISSALCIANMQAANRLYCILAVGISFLILSDGYVTNVVRKLRGKIVTMDKELLIDAIFKIQEMENLRLKESRTTAYRQGELAYHARRKWGRMQKIYFKCVANMDNMTHFEIIRDMCRLQRMDMDIYHATENMFQLEEEDLEPNADWRRSGSRRGAGAGRSDMRQYLSSADAALRDQMRKRTEHMRNTYLRTQPPVIDVQEELNFLDKNVSEVLLPRKSKEKHVDYDPEFVWPFIYY